MTWNDLWIVDETDPDDVAMLENMAAAGETVEITSDRSGGLTYSVREEC